MADFDIDLSTHTKTNLTFGALIENFLLAQTGHSVDRKISLRKLFENHIAKDVLSRKVTNLTSNDIEHLLSSAQNKHKMNEPLMAQRNRLIDALQQLLLWGRAAGHLHSSPITSKRALKVPEFSRTCTRSLRNPRFLALA
jgi:hypothetical protein